MEQVSFQRYDRLLLLSNRLQVCCTDLESILPFTGVRDISVTDFNSEQASIDSILWMFVQKAIETSEAD